MMFMERATVNSIFREYGSEFIQSHNVSHYTQKVIRAIADCRTENLGGHIQRCDSCGNEITVYNSCRNRHCPQCQFMKKEEWVQKKKNDILPFQYFHTVFTIPDALNPIVYRNKRIVYKLLFDAVKETLLSAAEDEKYFGAKIGFFSILHTWGQKLNLHPHIHAVVPGGGYDAKKDKWKSAPQGYLIPVEVLKKRFRSLFLTGLKRLYFGDKLYLKHSVFKNKVIFQGLIDSLFKKDWIVYIKESFRSSDSVIEYLSRYTHKIAISNSRILSLKDGVVSFSYKDYSEKNKKKVLRLPVMDFIQRFLKHIVPYRFVRIRYYGIMSNSTKKKQIARCFEYYNLKIKKYLVKSWQEIYRDVTGIDICQCNKCGIGKLVIVSLISAQRNRAGP